MNENSERPAPDVADLQKELDRVKYKKKYITVFKSTVFTLITVAAVAVLVATLIMPVFRIYGSSMTPTLNDGEIIVALKSSDLEKGDVIAFYYNNKILVKRVIATSGEWFDMDSEGNVSVNGKAIDEPYIDEKAFGECDLTLPYQVPEGRVFVMGDHRSVSVDSRSTVLGCVAEEQIVGKLFVRLWPLNKIRIID